MKTRHAILAITLLITAMAKSSMVNATENKPDVIATIGPVYSLVQMVLGDTANARLLVADTAVSVHNYQLKPSQQRWLRSADLVFLIDPKLEYFLPQLDKKSIYVALAHAEGVKLLDRGHDDEHESENAENLHGHKLGQGHHHGHSVDLHIWLDPINAIAMVNTIRDELMNRFPEYSSHFRKNAMDAIASLEEVHDQIAKSMAPLSQQPYIVFHDAYRYFETRYNLKGVGAILINPEVPPSAKQIRHIKQTITESGAVCVFSERQFSDKLVNTVTAGTGLRSTMLDPLGAEVSAGTDLYLKTIKNLASGFSNCLAP